MFHVSLACAEQHRPSAIGLSREDRCWSLNKNEPTWLIRSYLGIESREESAALEGLARDWGWQMTNAGWVCPHCARAPLPRQIDH